MVGATRTVTADLAAALTPPPQTADARELAMRLQRRYYLSVVELVDETSQKQQAISFGAKGVAALKTEPPDYQQAVGYFHAALNCCGLDSPSKNSHEYVSKFLDELPRSLSMSLSNVLEYAPRSPPADNSGSWSSKDGNRKANSGEEESYSIWRACARCTVRAGWSTDSQAIEVLERGQVVQVVDQRAGRLRLSATSVSGSSPSGPAGWVSIWNKEGATRLLERVHPPEPANFEPANFGAIETVDSPAVGPALTSNAEAPQSSRSSIPESHVSGLSETASNYISGTAGAIIGPERSEPQKEQPVDLEYIQSLLDSATTELQEERLARAAAENRSREAARTAFAAAQAARTAQTGSAASRIEASSSPRRAAQRALSIRSPTASSGLASTADNNEFGVVRISRGVHAAIANLWNESVPKRTISSINAHPLLSRALGLLLFNGEQEAATNASGCVESLSPAVADLSLEEVWLRVRSFAAEELPIDTNVLHQLLASSVSDSREKDPARHGGNVLTVGDVLRCLEEITNGALHSLVVTQAHSDVPDYRQPSDSRSQPENGSPGPAVAPTSPASSGLKHLRDQLGRGNEISDSVGSGLVAMLDSTIAFDSTLTALQATTSDDPSSLLHSSSSPDRSLHRKDVGRQNSGSPTASYRRTSSGGRQMPPLPSPALLRKRLLQQAVTSAAGKAVASRLQRLQLIKAAERSEAERSMRAAVSAAQDAAAAAAAATVGQKAEMEAAVAAAELRGRQAAEKDMVARIQAAEIEGKRRQDNAVAAARQVALAQGFAEGRAAAETDLARLRGQQEWELRQLSLQVSANAAVAAATQNSPPVATREIGATTASDVTESGTSSDVAIQLAQAKAKAEIETDDLVATVRAEAAADLQAVQAAADRAAVAAAEAAQLERERFETDIRMEVARELAAAESATVAARTAGAAEVERLGRVAAAQLHAVQEQHKVELKTVAKQRVEEVERRAELRLASTTQELQSEARLQQRQMESELARVQLEHHRALGEAEEASVGAIAARVQGIEAETSAALQATWAELEAANETLARAKAVVNAAARTGRSANRHGRSKGPTAAYGSVPARQRGRSASRAREAPSPLRNPARATSASRRISHQPSPLRGRPPAQQAALDRIRQFKASPAFSSNTATSNVNGRNRDKVSDGKMDNASIQGNRSSGISKTQTDLPIDL